MESVVEESILRGKVELIRVGINGSDDLKRANKLMVKLF
jgi:hypothetical protein